MGRCIVLDNPWEAIATPDSLETLPTSLDMDTSDLLSIDGSSNTPLPACAGGVKAHELCLLSMPDTTPDQDTCNTRGSGYLNKDRPSTSRARHRGLVQHVEVKDGLICVGYPPPLGVGVSLCLGNVQSLLTLVDEGPDNCDTAPEAKNSPGLVQRVNIDKDPYRGEVQKGVAIGVPWVCPTELSLMGCCQCKAPLLNICTSAMFCS